VRYRSFDSLTHMNQLALRWLAEEADPRVHGTVKEVVRERFDREAPHLGPLPATRFDTAYYLKRIVGWDGYVDVRGNRYSIPSEFCGQTVTVRLALDGYLTVLARDRKVAEHTLRSPAEGWVTAAGHHADLWRDVYHVQRRDLSVYEEVIPCS